MWQKLLTQFFIFILRTGIVFTPREEYEQKIAAIQPLSDKNNGYDDRLWSYQTVESTVSGRKYWYYMTKNTTDSLPIVCIHGLFLDGRTFINLAPYLPGKKLIALNLPQRSELYKGSINDYTTIVTDFLRSLAIDRCILMGVSFGGVIALHTTANAPDDLHIERIILAASLIPNATRKARENSRSTNDWMKSLEDYQLYKFVEKINHFTGKNYGKKHRQQLTRVLTEKHPDWYRQVAASAAGYNALDDAESLACPVLVLHADNDVFLDKKMKSIMSTTFQQVQCHTIKNSEHAMVFSMAETIAGYINSFCSESTPITTTGNQL